jgi:hypothetical protein
MGGQRSLVRLFWFAITGAGDMIQRLEDPAGFLGHPTVLSHIVCDIFNPTFLSIQTMIVQGGVICPLMIFDP